VSRSQPFRRPRQVRTASTSSSAAVLGLFAIALALLLVGVAAVQPDNRAQPPIRFRNLQNAQFEQPPPLTSPSETLARVWSDLSGPSGTAFLVEALPTQSGVLWIALIVAVAVGADFRRPGNPRNFELLALLSLGLLLFNVMTFFNHLVDPTYFRVMDWVFGAVMAVSLALGAIALWRVWHPHVTRWRPNLGVRPLVALTGLLLTLNLLVAIVRPPDDAGFYTNLGAQRFRETGQLPYGDPLLSGSAGSGYGPLLYMAHLPFQYLLGPSGHNRTDLTRDDIAAGATYYLPPILATQMATIAFHVVGVAALIVIARRLGGERQAWGLAALYCGSAYVMGVGGSREMIGGITFISHIAPAAVSLAAFAALTRPMLAGALLVAAAATVFYPVLFVPAWLGHYWRRRAEARQFLAGLVGAALIIGLPVLALSQPLPGRSLVGTIVSESVGHHQGTDTYGLSPFGFWGMRTGYRAALREPLVAGQFTTSPMFLLTVIPAALLFFVARGSTPQQLALITAVLGILAQWSKVHGTGVYVNWYYPFLLIGLFACRPPTIEGGSARASGNPM
jgi:hypothetical protein